MTIHNVGKDLIALSMGDPSGIGPEIIVRAAAAGRLDGACVVLGDVAVLRRAAQQCGVKLPIAQLDAPTDALLAPAGSLAVWQPPGLPSDLVALPMGRVDGRAGAAAACCIDAGAQLALRGEVAALVTAPIHKEALSAAGVKHPGHTEMLQALSGGAPVRMMLANDELRTVLVSIHVSLRDAIAAVTFDNVLQKFPEIAEQVHIMAEERQQRNLQDQRNVATIKPEHARIEGLRAVYDSKRILLDWRDVQGVNGYQVARWNDDRETA